MLLPGENQALASLLLLSVATYQTPTSALRSEEACGGGLGIASTGTPQSVTDTNFALAKKVQPKVSSAFFSVFFFCNLHGN